MIFARTAPAEPASPPRTIEDVRKEINETDEAMGRNAEALKQALANDPLAAAILGGRLQLVPGTNYRIDATTLKLVRERETLLRKWSELLAEHARLKEIDAHV